MASLSDLFTLFEQVRVVYDAGKERVEKYRSNPELAENLDALFKTRLHALTSLDEELRNNAAIMTDQERNIFTVYVKELYDELRETCTKLDKKVKQLGSRRYRFVRAIATGDWLSELEASAIRVDQLLHDIVKATVTTKNTAATTKNTAAVSENTAAVEKLSEVVGGGSETRRDKDSFCPSFDVPENSPHVVLNFQSASQSDQAAARPPTIESKLKSVVLGSDGSQSIGAVGSSLAHAVGTKGMSGVGKSCALLGMAKDPEIRERFRDGIYYIILGKDARDADVVEQVAKVIEASGGIQMARKVREEGSVNGAVLRAREWFAGKRVLLLIDDAWAENDSCGDIVVRLSCIADIAVGSRVAFTTRDLSIGLGSVRIDFASRDPYVSREILLGSAGVCEEEEVGTFVDIVQDVLELCCGIPMALATAGSAIRVALVSTAGATSAEVWDEYLSELQAHPKYLLRDKVYGDAYGNLSSAFSASLSMLDKRLIRILHRKPLMSMLEMYRALIVLQRQGWIPVSVLERLWDTNDKAETIRVVRALANANLAQLEYRMVSGTNTPGISLHDLHLRYVQDECNELGESKKWHHKLLNGYLPGEDSSGSQSSDGLRNWCKDEVLADEYIRNNLSRHLVGAGLGRELHRLLMNPKWAAKRLCAHEILQLERDVGMMIEVLREGMLYVGPGDDEWPLKMIAGAARLSSMYVSRNGAEVWFQLYARLLPWSEQLEIIRTYLVDIERCAERPWVKALSACLPGPGGALQSTVLCEGDLMWISQLDDGGSVVACGTCPDKCGDVFVSTIMGGQVEKTVWLVVRDDNSVSTADESSTSARDYSARAGSDDGSSSAGSYDSSSAASDDGSAAGSGSRDRVSAMCCARDGTLAVTGHVSGAVRLWNAETGKSIGDALRGHDSRVACVALSADGKRAVSGSFDETVRVWDVETGEQIGDALRGHVAEVACVALSAKGKRVVSGSMDETVRVWNAETGEQICDALRGHDNWVKSVALSADGKRVASGSMDKTVRVWNADTGEPIRDALCGHRSGVFCVALSADGKRVASGSSDQAVRMWNVETGEEIRDALRGHGLRVVCVAWSADGKQVVSGSWDRTVRVWNAETGKQMGDALRERRFKFSCVALSADGTRVMSGSRNAKVQMWNAMTGGQMGDALRGHGDKVECLALSADGKRGVSGSWDKTVRVWNTETGEQIGDALRGHRKEVVSVALSANGKRVVSGSMDKTVRIWTVETGEQIADALRGHREEVECVALSADGTRAASGSRDKLVRVWNAETGEPIGEALRGHRNGVSCVALSAEGKRAASGSWDKTVRVWDVETGACLHAEDNWTCRDVSRLRLLLGEEGAASGNEQEESRVRFGESCIMHGSADDNCVLATLERRTLDWDYSEASRRVVSRSVNGDIEFVELVL